MCDPTAIAMMALQAAGGAMSAMESNARSDQNRAAAISSMNVEQTSETKRFVEESRAATEEAYELALEGRAEEARFLNFAAEGGVEGISVNEGLFAVKNVGGRQSQRYRNEADSRSEQSTLNLKAITSTAESRINSVPTQSVIGGALTGAVSGASSAFGAGYFDTIIKPRKET